MPNYYQILNVLPSSSDRDIRIAYRKLALKHHPDKNQSANPEAFHAIQNAYEILSNEARRKEFDSLLSASQNNDLNAFFDRFFGIHRDTFDTCRSYLLCIPSWKNKILENLIPLQREAHELRNLFEYSFSDFSEQVTRPSLIKEKITIYLAWIASKDDAEALANKSFRSIFGKNYPFSKSYSGDSFIMTAAALGAKRVIKTAFELGLFNIIDLRKGLSVAIANHDHDMTFFLLSCAESRAINVSHLNDAAFYKEKYDPFFWAIRTDNVIAVKLLLHLNIDQQNYQLESIENETYLHLAARVGNIDVVRVLVSEINIGHKDVCGDTALDHALDHKNTAIAQFLSNYMSCIRSRKNKDPAFFSNENSNAIEGDIDIELLQSQLYDCMEPFVYYINESPKLLESVIKIADKPTRADLEEIIHQTITDPCLTSKELSNLCNALIKISDIAFMDEQPFRKFQGLYAYDDLKQLVYDFSIVKLAEKASALSSKRYDIALLRVMVSFYINKIAKYYMHAETLLNCATKMGLKTETDFEEIVKNFSEINENDALTLIDDLVEINRLAHTDHKTLRLTNSTLYLPEEIAEMVCGISLKAAKEKHLAKINKNAKSMSLSSIELPHNSFQVTFNP